MGASFWIGAAIFVFLVFGPMLVFAVAGATRSVQHKG